MANFKNKFRLKVAQPSKYNRMTFNQSHLTTTDFMKVQPVFRKQLVPGDRISVDLSCVAKLMPMPQPTMGSAQLKTRAFFVPYRTVFPAFNDFITGNVNDSAVLPTISNRVIEEFFTNESGLGENRHLVSTNTTSGIDFSAYNPANQNNQPYQFTSLGRYIYKIFRSLGYDFIPSYAAKDEGVYCEYKYNALPLLAFVKAYFDWYYPSQYYTANLDELLKVQTIDNGWLVKVFGTYLWSMYDDGYFVSAFDTPNGPLSSNSFQASIQDNQNTGASVDLNTPDFPETSPVMKLDKNTPKFTQYMVEVLHKLSDYMKRNQLVGARAVDRYLARFGIALDSSKVNRSLYLGGKVQNVITQSVETTANTSEGGDSTFASLNNNSMVGGFAGRGVIPNEQSQFSYETTEYGEFIIVSSLVPQNGNVQGIDRDILYSSPMDFYQPEFDMLGNQAISASELYIPKYELYNFSGHDVINQVFGWTPRYSEYKVARDRLTGDISLLRSVGKNYVGWHMFRLYENKSFNNSSTNMVHSLDYMQGRDADQFDRIFYYTDGLVDSFYLEYYFNINLETKMLPMYDYMDWDEVSNSNTVNVDANGSKVN